MKCRGDMVCNEDDRQDRRRAVHPITHAGLDSSRVVTRDVDCAAMETQKARVSRLEQCV